MALIFTLSVTLAITGAASCGCFWLRETEINNLTERLRAARAREQSTAHAYANLLRETTAARGLVFENMVLREQLGRSRQAQEVLRERLREGAEAPVSAGGSPSTGEIEIIDHLTVASPFEPPFPTDFLVSAILIFFVFSLLIYVVIRAAKNLLCMIITLADVPYSRAVVGAATIALAGAAAGIGNVFSSLTSSVA